MKQYTARRNEKIEVVLNQEEKRIIVEQARKQGLPISTYIRFKLLKSENKS